MWAAVKSTLCTRRMSRMTVRLRLRSGSNSVNSRSVVPKNRLPCSSQTVVNRPACKSASFSVGRRCFFDEIWWPPSLRRITELRICSRMKSIMARANPTPAAAIRL